VKSGDPVVYGGQQQKTVTRWVPAWVLKLV
jgi:hypothetical protein